MTSTIETVVRSVVGRGVDAVAGLNRHRLEGDAESHPFLSGIHQPMHDERTLTDLAVTGVLPPALAGRYLRIGPNPVRPDGAGYHWFSGDGMVHGVSLTAGRPRWYRNRWIRSHAVSAALGELPAAGPRHGRSDTVNTNVVGIGGRTWALVEAGAYPVELDETLGVQHHNPFDGTLHGSFTAHPHRDPVSGDSHAIAYDATEPDRVRHIVLDRDGRVTREEPIAVADGPSIHDSAFTARFVLILDLPVTFSMGAMLGGHLFPYAWDPAHRARVGLLPKDGTDADVIWCDVDPTYVFHIANAYDAADGTVVIDLVAYDTMFAASRQGPDAFGRFERWTIDPVARSVVRRVVDPYAQEFPRIDERRFGMAHRYAYTIAIGQDSEAAFAGAPRLYKHDMATNTRTVHEFGERRVPGEFVFVPAHTEAAEDEGWLIGYVVDTATDTTDLAILDAMNVAAPPVARIHIPHRVPPGFHGNWLPDERSSRRPDAMRPVSVNDGLTKRFDVLPFSSSGLSESFPAL